MERIVRENPTSDVIGWGEWFGVKPDLSKTIEEDRIRFHDAIIDEIPFDSVLGKGIMRFIKNRDYYEENRAESLVQGLEEPLLFQSVYKDGEIEANMHTLPVHIEIEFGRMTSRTKDTITVLLSYKNKVFHWDPHTMDKVEEGVYPVFSSDWIDSENLRPLAIAAACNMDGEKQIEAVRFAFIRKGP